MLQAFQRQALYIIHHGSQGNRTFFNFPKFPSSNPFPHNESYPQSYHERKILPYRRSELYKIITDVASYSDFVPYCTGSRILESKARQDRIMVIEAELTVGFLAFKESYVSTVTCKPHESVEAVASSSSPLFKTLTTVWRFQPAAASSPLPSTVLLHHSSEQSSSSVVSQSLPDQGPTLVTLDLTFAFVNAVHATVSATFFGQMSKLMVKAFEERCVALYGLRTK